MDSRREFLKKAAMLSGSAGLAGIFPASIQRAFAIDPAPGSTYLDAEHVVILMQENRSFDHCYGSLRGVRGFNDPRAVTLPDKNKVWLQSNAAGQTYAPFRLNIRDTKSTWMGSLPHSWTDQNDARNEGRHDQWLTAKRSGHKEYADMPLTMGYYNREDIPFYYALADAFTVCDQNFCSSLTGTTPNRLYLWTGTVREKQDKDSYANVRNENVGYSNIARWKTFPEQLEENNISWKIYQNELSVGVDLEGEEDAWLSNFTDNPIEWFEQYHVKFLPAYMEFLPKKEILLGDEIKTLEEKIKAIPATDRTALMPLQRRLQQRQAQLKVTIADQKIYTKENYEKLSAREKSIHEKAFTTNKNDPNYHNLSTLKYKDGSIDREVQVPAGDVLYQFREDVKNGTLPTVSWLVAPENFSDHPGAPWYGTWYLSESMDILTKNPEVWKKTIFILAYDENDGYFDHVPPFTAPDPNRPDSGMTSTNIDPEVEYVTLAQDMTKKARKDAREGSIGLGFRVPLVIASPWNRGGSVCSEIFDHTSIIQFLEKFLSHKTGKKIEQPAISSWRRTVCGDLSSTFKPYNGEKIPLPAFQSKNAVIEGVHKAKFKKDPSGFHLLKAEDIAQINKNPASSPYMAKQEKGTRPSCPLPYQLYADGKLSDDKKTFSVKLHASNEIFGAASAGSPFNIYSPEKYKVTEDGAFESVRTRAYAVSAGDTLVDSWALNRFENETYHLCVNGPNGFFREFIGNNTDPQIDIACEYQRKGGKLTGNIEFRILNSDNKPHTVEIRDHAYKRGVQNRSVPAKGRAAITLDLSNSVGWYDYSVRLAGADHFEKRYAGRVENGQPGISDPAMGMV